MLQNGNVGIPEMLIVGGNSRLLQHYVELLPWFQEDYVPLVPDTAPIVHVDYTLYLSCQDPVTGAWYPVLEMS